MKVTPTALPGVLLVAPVVHGDARGYFMEAFSAARYAEAGIRGPFVQDNVARSSRGVLRGLHLQEPHSQGKLVWVAEGAVYDVAVDVRVGSPTFGQWVGAHLSAENHHQLWVPPGFAHGYVVTSETALFAYKCTDYYHPASERTIRWDDPRLAIDWPVAGGEVVVSPRDAAAATLDQLDASLLPRYAG